MNEMLLTNNDPATAVDALKRARVDAVTGEFLKKTKGKKLYFVTLTAKSKMVHSSKIWFSENAREKLLLDLFDSFEYGLNCLADKNWKRRPTKPVISLGAIENYEKNSTVLVAPHIHALVALPEEFAAFLEISLESVPSPKGPVNTFPLVMIKNDIWAEKCKWVASIAFGRLDSIDEFYAASSYSFDREYATKDKEKIIFDTTNKGVRPSEDN